LLSFASGPDSFPETVPTRRARQYAAHAQLSATISKRAPDVLAKNLIARRIRTTTGERKPSSRNRKESGKLLCSDEKHFATLQSIKLNRLRGALTNRTDA
jgi:hypothetical protein